MGQRVAINVSVTRLVDDYPDILRETLLSAFITDDSIPARIVDGALNGFNKKADAYYRYGRDNFVEGLPGRATFTTGSLATDKEAATKAVIEAEVGEEIVIDTFAVRKVNLNALGFEYLQDTAGINWDPIRQQLTHTDGKKYYIASAEFVGGFLHLKMQLSTNRYTVFFAQGGASSIPLTIITDIAPVSLDTTYYHVVYHLASDIYYSRRYWNFRYVPGVHPTLDFDDDIITGSTFLPIAPVRRNKVNVVDDTTYNRAQKKSVRRLLDTIDLDLDQLTEQLNDPNDPNNLDDVDEVFVMFAMGVEDTSPMALSYMFETFRAFHINEGTTQTQWLDWWNLDEEVREATPRPKNAIYIDDSTVSMQMEWNFTTMALKNGIAGTGSAPNPFTIVPGYTPAPKGPAEGDLVTRTIVIDGTVGGGNTPLEFNEETQANESKLPDDDSDDHFVTHSLVYRRQLTSIAAGDASDTYEELLIHGLHTTYNVYRGPAKGRGEFVRDVVNMADGGFIIPVSRDVVEEFSGFDESKIYYQSLKVIVYALNIQNLGFFQSGLFGAIIAVVAITIAVITQQPWIAYAGLTGAAAVTVFILVTLAVGYITQKAFEVIAEVVGGDVALAIAAILAVYALTKGDTKIFGKLITAEDFLFLSNSAFSAANQEIQDEIQGIIQEGILEAKALAEEQQALDARVLEEFGDQLAPELYDIITPKFNMEFDMNIATWHDTKIGNGNPGVLVLDLPRTYHKIALAIPDTVKRAVNKGTTLEGI